MEESISLIVHGFNLVKELESNLPNLANQLQPADLLSQSLDEIIKIFSTAKERLNQNPTNLYYDSQQVMQNIDASSLQEWLRCGGTQTMESIQPQFLAGIVRGKDLEGNSARLKGGAVGGAVQATSKGTTSSSSQRTRRRKDEEERQTVRVPAPRMGNTEIAPDDNFTWRKYGQKEILGSRFPRAYYRCTHQKLYDCPAKKQVQRLDDDPHTFLVTYRGNHTCHMSATAPSIAPPPPPPEITQETGRWLSMDFSTTTTLGADGGAGPSAVGYGKEVDHYPLVVADMADAMFNSGSSSGNSMNFIFPSDQEDKWDPEDKKN